MKLLFVFLIAFVLACSGVSPSPIPAPAPAPTPKPEVPACPREVSTHFFVDPSFTIAQGLAIVGAVEDWYVWSGGYVKLTVHWEGAGSPKIRSVFSFDEETKRVEARSSAEQAREVNVYGWAPGSDVVLVIDRIPEDGFRGIVAHELGHAIGMRWSDGRKDPWHVEGPGSIMSPAYEVGNAWTEKDHELCRASCLCP